MTKADEIKLLSSFTASIPKDSYLRPWLESVLPQVESDIRSDFMVSPSIPESRRHCQDLITQAEEKASQLIAAAEQESQRRIARAERHRELVTQSIHAAQRELNQL